MLKRLKFSKKILLFGFFVLIVNHFLLKDFFYLSGIVFYAFPLLGIIGIGIFCAIIFSKETLILKALTLVIIILGIYWWYHAFHFAPEISENDNQKTVLFWNIAKQKDRPLNIIANHVKTESPEFICLVEAHYISDSIFNRYQNQLSDYHLVRLKGKMLFGSKTPVTNVYFEGINDDYAFNHLSVGANANKVEILIVDLYGSPLHNKKPPFEIIYNYLNNHHIDFILGDFNTPYESIYFRKFENNYQSFHGLNSGFTYTWPKGLPLYELDQIWISKKHKALKLQKLNYPISDHSLLIGHFAFENGAQD